VLTCAPGADDAVGRRRGARLPCKATSPPRPLREVEASFDLSSAQVVDVSERSWPRVLWTATPTGIWRGAGENMPPQIRTA
jgi:hypothetical protein